MLTVEEALSAVVERVSPLSARRVALSDSLGCRLAEDVFADIDLPPFDKALVDGFAVRSSDLEGGNRRLKIGEEIPAGRTPSRTLAPSEAALVMTGAPLPNGADAVVMFERTTRIGDEVRIEEDGVQPGWNRLRRGREMHVGDVVLRKGDRLNPARLGLLASVGRSTPLVTPRPTVRVVPTGDELVEPDQAPGPSKIRNSNAAMLSAMGVAEGAIARTSAIVPDEPEALLAALSVGLSADVLLITGGVSAGRKDLVPGALAELRVEQVFHKVRLKPGKPLWFGVGRWRADGPGTLVFGLPGNPVSGIVGFLLFVRPAIRLLRGIYDGGRSTTPARLAAPFTHRGDRPTYHPSRWLTDSSAHVLQTLVWAGSADLRTIASADGFAIFPAGDRTYEQGEEVQFLALEPQSIE